MEDCSISWTLTACPPTQLEWSMKLWWPHNEALIALLMAYTETGNELLLERFEEVFDYSFSHVSTQMCA